MIDKLIYVLIRKHGEVLIQNIIDNIVCGIEIDD